MTAGRPEGADVQQGMPDLYVARPDDRHDDQTVLIRRMLASSASLLEHLDECAVCRDDGCRWCDDLGTLTTMLRYDRRNLDTMYREALARADGHPVAPPHLATPGPHLPPEHLTRPGPHPVPEHLQVERPAQVPPHLARFGRGGSK